MRRYSGLLAGCTALWLANAAVDVDFSMATYGTGSNPTALPVVIWTATAMWTW